MVNQSSFTEIYGIRIFLVKSGAELKASAPEQGTQKRILIMDAPNDNRQDLIADVEVTLPFVDEYIFCYEPQTERIKRYQDSDDEDTEPDSIESFPRIIQSRLQIDVPYEFARNQHQALHKAWRRVQSGDTLIVITQSINETLDILQHVNASVPRTSSDTASTVPRRDEDPSA
jgi:hypothetical protein